LFFNNDVAVLSYFCTYSLRLASVTCHGGLSNDASGLQTCYFTCWCTHQVERLASGLRHELAFVAAALDVSEQKAATFASNMLGVLHVPAVLLYPEAARGCLKFLGGGLAAAELDACL
jgi:hypothetical protein